MTRDPVCLLESETLVDAARVMRDRDIGDVIVLDDTHGRVTGIVTDRDVVVRALADGREPAQTTLGSICSTELITLSSDKKIDDAVRIMRTKAIRRVPIVQGDKPVGIVSIGDLAERLDKQSALAEISSAPPNG